MAMARESRPLFFSKKLRLSVLLSGKKPENGGEQAKNEGKRQIFEIKHY
ncbi:MAG: hypothetical protein FWG03_09255 [Clostridiales bacterium]|nr:hypothetical protein [Clostridiales bacterium]